MARTVAGIGVTGKAVVKNVGLRIYPALAFSALMLAQLWQWTEMPAGSPQLFAIHSYQHLVGDMDGRSCPAYPVCSSYAEQALRQHGWLVGSWLMLDRLIHEGGDLQHEHGPRIVFKGEVRLHDPLSRNDFWLTKE